MNSVNEIRRFWCGQRTLILEEGRSPILIWRLGGENGIRSRASSNTHASPRTSQHEKSAAQGAHTNAKDLTLADYAGDMGGTRGASFQLKSPFLTYGALAILITIVIVAYQGRLLTQVHTYLGG